jgi:antagonist of KipI
MHLLVRRAGFLTTVQDLGRSGYRASGVSVGGALDPHALRVANLLVGNNENAAGLELTLGMVRFQFETDRLIAWCGGPFEARIGDEAVGAGRVARVNAGEELQLTSPPEGARAWLAVSGGIDVPAVLGSRSTDLRSRFGGVDGRALRDGDRLRLGLEARLPRVAQRVATWFAPNEWSSRLNTHPYLHIVRGAEWSQFATDTLTSGAFTVSPESDRMGVRLGGPIVARRTSGDLQSEAVAPGTIQVPPNGQPILLLGDCQTIGGYPKIAHVITVDLASAAQLRPGDTVRFIEASLAEAQQLLAQRERDLARFRVGLQLQAQWT